MIDCRGIRWKANIKLCSDSMISSETVEIWLRISRSRSLASWADWFAESDLYSVASMTQLAF